MILICSTVHKSFYSPRFYSIDCVWKLLPIRSSLDVTAWWIKRQWYFLVLIISSVLTSSPTPLAEIQPLNMTEPPLGFTDGWRHSLVPLSEPLYACWWWCELNFSNLDSSLLKMCCQSFLVKNYENGAGVQRKTTKDLHKPWRTIVEAHFKRKNKEMRGDSRVVTQFRVQVSIDPKDQPLPQWLPNNHRGITALQYLLHLFINKDVLIIISSGISMVPAGLKYSAK